MATVTIDKVYFETLIRRVEPHVTSDNFVTIPRADHDALLRMAREYTLLRSALYRGGIAHETLEILINGNDSYDDAVNQDAYTQPAENGQPSTSTTLPFTSLPPHVATLPKEIQKFGCGQDWQPQSDTNGKLRPPPYSRNCSFDHDDTSYPSDEKDEMTHGFAPAQQKQNQARDDRRTLAFKGLGERTTHKDIVDVVCGGALLDIFLRPRERMASISFVDGAAAQTFFAYARRNDIYIHGKRVEVVWNDRQFIMPHHVAQKIANGATRNITVHNITPAVSADSIREDLDHIHNLVVIDTKFENGNAYISLNSVHNSLFARTCMRSRLKFKGMLIDWYPDACARPLPQITYAPRRENLQPVAKKLNPMANRFQLLNMDGTEDGSEDGEEDLTQTSITSIGLNTSWADNSIAV